MSLDASWPAVAPVGLPDLELNVERGIWGKVHGAGSDYRWIAASPGIDVQGFGHQLYLGSEDLAMACHLWRALPNGRFLAIAVRPSRAVDAAGRSGFLERQVLVFDPPAGQPAALLALAATAVLDCWPGLEQQAEIDPDSWLQPDFRLPLERLLIRCRSEELAGRIAEGRRILAELVGEVMLVDAFARARRRQWPVFLAASEPLPAVALACLLLPFPAGLAGELSVAGGLPSSRFLTADLGQVWNFVVAPTPHPLPAPAAEDLRWAQPVVEALLGGEPARLPEFPAVSARSVALEKAVVEGPVAIAAPEPPDWLTTVQQFVGDDSWRWLSQAELPHVSLLEPWWAGQLARWVTQFELRAKPPHADAAHWQVKLEVLQALLLATAPREALKSASAGERVPPLLFVSRLDTGSWLRLRQELGERFESLLRQSLASPLPARCFDRSRLAELIL